MPSRGATARAIAAILVALALSAPAARAHDEHHDTHDVHEQEAAFGRAGDPHKIDRTVRIEMSDAMRYSPAAITVRQGETIRIVATNTGRTKHELVLGTPADLKAHAELMRKYPGMEHEEASMMEVPPGKTGEIVWLFDTPGEFEYGCLIPGHYEAGMVGRITVIATSNRRGAQ